jgi:histidinol-phosphatase
VRRGSGEVSDRKLREYTEFSAHLAELAGRRILPYFRTALAVSNKARGRRAPYDPVTAADRDAEHAIRAEIRRVYPTHGIYGEEHGRSAGADRFTWVIDPIDGTRAFIIGQLHWGVLVGLNDGARPIAGAMHQPYTGETFVGSRLGAELRRGRERLRLRTRRCARIGAAVVCATSPSMFARRGDAAAFRALASRARYVRFGGDCYSYCLLAAGFIDIVIETGLHPYDVQALVPIIEAAGGAITTWSGEPAGEGGRVIAAGDRTLHGQLLRMLQHQSNTQRRSR